MGVTLVEKSVGVVTPRPHPSSSFFSGGPDLFRLVVVAFSRGLVTPGTFFRSLSFLSSQGVLGGADGDDVLMLVEYLLVLVLVHFL